MAERQLPKLIMRVRSPSPALPHRRWSQAVQPLLRSAATAAETGRGPHTATQHPGIPAIASRRGPDRRNGGLHRHAAQERFPVAPDLPIKRRSDARIRLSRCVLVNDRCLHRVVAHASHQVPCAHAAAGRQVVARMAKVVKSQARRPELRHGLLPPHELVEVPRRIGAPVGLVNTSAVGTRSTYAATWSRSASNTDVAAPRSHTCAGLRRTQHQASTANPDQRAPHANEAG
jgi:hypothetical protein